MNIHEYQAKQLLENYSIPTPESHPAHSVKEAVSIAQQLGGDTWVVKAQVHAGGRGKAGGVKIVSSPGQLEQTAKNLLGQQLITKQSAPDGQPVNCLLVQKTAAIRSEFYLALLIDRSTRRVTLIASSQGGMDIETVASKEPESITQITIDPILGVQDYQVRRIADCYNLEKQHQKTLAQIVHALYSLFLEKDLSLLEINPFILSKEDTLIALDAKISIDDNALFRHPDLHALYDPTQEDTKENKARKFDLNYIALSGNIACMVNGAGLAMATMDIIKLHGGDPANFLDVGGNATTEKVSEAFKLILSDPGVEAILINIFGGIVRCDLIAEGIIQAVSEIGVAVPIVIRLEGTNAQQGKDLLLKSALDLITADDLDDAAEKAVNAAKGNH